jgi:hypothetical protein
VLRDYVAVPEFGYPEAWPYWLVVSRTLERSVVRDLLPEARVSLLNRSDAEKLAELANADMANGIRPEYLVRDDGFVRKMALDERIAALMTEYATAVERR